MSFQDKAQHQISQIDKEVSVHMSKPHFQAVAYHLPIPPLNGHYYYHSHHQHSASTSLYTNSYITLQLSKYPVLNNFEKQTSVPKVYAFLGLVGLYFFLVFFNIGGEFLVNFAGFVLPGYYSLEALFSTSKVDDTQWLTVRNNPRSRSARTTQTWVG